MKKTKVFVVLGLLCALEIILTRFVQIPISLFGSFTDRISLGFLPIMLAGAFFGPIAGGITGGLSDIIRALILPQGPFNPLFTVPAILRGVVYGLILNKKITFPRILTASLLIFLLINVLLTNYLINFSYGNPFLTVLIGRIPTTTFNFIVQLSIGSLIGIPLERDLGYVRKW